MSMPRVLPAYAGDTPLADLRTPEHFLIHVARLWAEHHDASSPGPCPWRHGFAMAGLVVDAAADFEALMRIVFAAAPGVLDIRCPRCPRLGTDEGRLLQAVSLLQHRQDAEAVCVLSEWLPPAAVRAAHVRAEALARALAGRKLVVPLRRVLMVPPHETRIPANAGRGLSLVH